MKLKIIILIFIYIQIIQTKIIKIPFKTYYNTTNINETNFIRINYLSRIGTEIELGTPSQKLFSAFHLQVFSTIVQSKDTKCEIEPLFDSNHSTTLIKEKKSISFYFEAFTRAFLSKDKVNIGNNKLKLENFIFLLTEDITDNSILNPIIIGLRLQQQSFSTQLPETNLINYLYDNKYINLPIFTFEFNSDDEGEFIIGENPYNDKDFSYISVGLFSGPVNMQTWGFKCDKIYYGNESIYDKTFDLIFEVEQKFFVSNSEYKYKVQNEFFFKHNDTCKRESTNIEKYKSIYYYVCDKNVDLNDMKPLTFYIKHNEFNFTFLPSELFIEFKEKKFFIVVFTNEINSQWTVGRYFLKKYQLYFDRDKKVIGYYKNGKKNYNLYFFLLIITLVIIIIILIYYIQYHIKKSRKKRMNEIEDEFDYVSQNNNTMK